MSGGDTGEAKVNPVGRNAELLVQQGADALGQGTIDLAAQAADAADPA